MENPRFRVLQVVAGMNRGGTETMLMNHYRALDKTECQFDFLVHTDKECAYDKEILSMGGRIFHTMPIRPWNYIGYFKWLDKFFEKHASEYIAVHGHIQENSGFALHYAKKHGIKNRLMSSHIAPQNIDYKFVFREFARLFFKNSATTKIACGHEAGIYLYRNNDFMVMKNAIDSGIFQYNTLIRKKIRENLGISDDKIVIGNVARFCPQKNHTQMVRLFSEFVKKRPNALLVLVGTGPLLQDIKGQVNNLGISKNVLFLGLRSDIPSLLQAFDVFFMPSLYEGLPVSVIEAQAAGLPCVLSDTIDRGCDVTGNIKFIPLSAPSEEWVDAIMDASKKPRTDCQQKIIDAGYDVNNNLKILLPLYGIK